MEVMPEVWKQAEAKLLVQGETSRELESKNFCSMFFVWFFLPPRRFYLVTLHNNTLN